jgi:predicted DCC family thiol-disulfide oxidoreductase YuxK
VKTFPVVRFVYGGVDSESASEGRPYTLVYDGQCRVCGRLVRLLDRWDKDDRIEAVPSQNSSVHVRFPWIPPDAYAESVQLVGPGGRTWQGAGAIEELLRVLPRGRLLGWAFGIPYVDRAADRLYRWFARNRYRFGCGEHCQYRPLHLRHGDEFPEEPDVGGATLSTPG